MILVLLKVLYSLLSFEFFFNKGFNEDFSGKVLILKWRSQLRVSNSNLISRVTQAEHGCTLVRRHF